MKKQNQKRRKRKKNLKRKQKKKLKRRQKKEMKKPKKVKTIQINSKHPELFRNLLLLR